MFTFKAISGILGAEVKNNMRGVIYCYFINGKYYVGKTYGSERKRKNQHYYDSTHGTQTPFCNAIRKYGWENVLKTYQVLEIVEKETLQGLNYELIERECYWIREKNSLLPNGYNVHFSNHKKVPYVPNKKERYEKVSKALKGKYMNQEYSSKKIKCVETGIEYPSVRECERQMGFAKNTISNVLNGKYKTHKGYHFTYTELPNIEYIGDVKRKKYATVEEANEARKKYTKKVSKPIVCIETNEVYESIREAVRAKYDGNENCRRQIQESIKYGWKVKGYTWKLLNQGNPVPSASETGKGATTN